MEDRDTSTGVYVIAAILLGIALVVYWAAATGRIVISFHM